MGEGARATALRVPTLSLTATGAGAAGRVVALMKDAGGDIRLTLPVTGELSSPKFGFGTAIKQALRHVLSGLLTAPFRALGSAVRRTRGSGPRRRRG